MGIQLKRPFGGFFGFEFGMITLLLSYISDLIVIGFREHNVSGFAMNATVAYHLKYAVTGISPDFGINLPQLSFSQGKLIGPKSFTAEALASAKVKFSWRASEDVRKLTNPADSLMTMVYNSEKTEFITSTDAAFRSALTYMIRLPVDCKPLTSCTAAMKQSYFQKIWALESGNLTKSVIKPIRLFPCWMNLKR